MPTATPDSMTPRKRLSALMQQHAQENGLLYGESWLELDRCFSRRYRVSLFKMRKSYCEDHGLKLTLPAFLEEAHRLDQVLAIAQEMTGNGKMGPPA